MRFCRNYIWLALTTMNLVLVSCPIIHFHLAQTTEERLIAVLVLLGCLLLLTVVDALIISMGNGLTRVTAGSQYQSSGRSKNLRGWER